MTENTAGGAAGLVDSDGVLATGQSMGRRFMEAQIATLPPIPDPQAQLLISPSTGEPSRHPLLGLAVGLLYSAGIVSGVVFVFAWLDMIQISGFNLATRLGGLINHAPYEWETVIGAVGVFAIAAVLIFGPFLVGYHAWKGRGASRLIGLGVLVSYGLAWFMNRWAWLAVPLLVAGLVVLLLPAVGDVFTRFKKFHKLAATPPAETSPVIYGRAR